MGVYITYNSGFWPAFIFYLLGLLAIAFELFIGPITVIQKLVENGEIEKSKSLLKSVRFPNLLYKPIRSAFYMLESNFATLNEDFDKAEEDIKKSIASGSSDPSLGGMAYMQLGMIAMKKGNNKEAFENLRKAVKEGIPDKDSEAGAYLQLASLSVQRRDYRAAKNYFRKAKSLKPQNPEIKSQIKEMERYISRIPG